MSRHQFGPDHDHRHSHERSQVFRLFDANQLAAALGAGLDPNQTDALGVTLLMRAATMEATDAVASLLRAGADVNVADREGTTALMYASRAGEIESTRLLLAAGADPRSQNHRGETAASLASQAVRQIAVRIPYPSRSGIVYRQLLGTEWCWLECEGNEPNSSWCHDRHDQY